MADSVNSAFYKAASYTSDMLGSFGIRSKNSNENMSDEASRIKPSHVHLEVFRLPKNAHKVHTYQDDDYTHPEKLPKPSAYSEIEVLHVHELSFLQKRVRNFLKWEAFEVFMNLIIVANVALVVAETNASRVGYTSETWMGTANVLLLLFYTCEISLRIFASRRQFFRFTSSVADLIIVSFDACFEIVGWFFKEDDMPSLSIFRLIRIFRLLRLRRGFRSVSHFPELRIMIFGLFGAFKAILWGSLLVATILLLWSILFVQLIHPLNVEIAKSGIYEGCDRCERAFDGVSQAFLTLIQQILAGDSWGQVCVPIIEYSPMTIFLFVPALLSINLAVLNLILAVIVDKAQEARDDDVHNRAVHKQMVRRYARDQILELCRELDLDESGSISFVELVRGFEMNQEFQDMLLLMDISKEDLKTFFDIIDVHGHGECSYSEFFNQLYKFQAADSHTLLVMIKFYLLQVRRTLMQHGHAGGHLANPAWNSHGGPPSHHCSEQHSEQHANDNHEEKGLSPTASKSILEKQPSTQSPVPTDALDEEETIRDRLDNITRQCEQILFAVKASRPADSLGEEGSPYRTRLNGSQHLLAEAGKQRSNRTIVEILTAPEQASLEKLSSACDQKLIAGKKHDKKVQQEDLLRETGDAKPQRPCQVTCRS